MRKYLGILSVLLVISFLWAGAFSPFGRSSGFYAHAHAGEEHSASYNLAAISIAQDEVVAPEKLGVDTPKVLPGSPFYFFKNLGRGVQSLTTFSAEKKAELKFQFANEKIVEAQLLQERGDNSRAVEHLKSYEKDLARAKGVADKEKFIVQSIRHQAVIDKIEKEASEEQVADIKSIREKSVGHVAEVVASIDNAEAAKNALILATSDEGSAFKPLRNLEVLKAVEEKAPEQAKEAIRGAQENAVKRFKSDYDKGTDEEKTALTDYIKSAGGDASRYTEVFTENKETLGEELSQKLIAAGEEKKAKIVAEEIKPLAFSSDNVECVPPVSPKPSVQPKSEVGEMTITPEISEVNKDNVITVSVFTSSDPFNVHIRPEFHKISKSTVIDWGPKEDELPKDQEVSVGPTRDSSSFMWETHRYFDEKKRLAQGRPRLLAKKYWVKFRVPDQTVPLAADQNVGSYGWKKIEYVITSASSEGILIGGSGSKTSSGKGAYYVGGPQYPVGKIVRVGNYAEYGKPVTVKAGETFEVEAKPTGWQGGTLGITELENGRIIGPDSITVKSGESAIWKIFPKGTYPVKGSIHIKNNCNSLSQFVDRIIYVPSGLVTRAVVGIPAGTFEVPIKYDFKGLTKEKSQLNFHGAIAHVLEFGKPDSALNVTPVLLYMDGTIVAAKVPDFTLELAAVYKDNPQEVAKNILITPKGKAQQAGSATAVTNKDGETFFKITAPNVTREEVTRGILLKTTAPAISGLKFETELHFTGITIEVTKPVPVVEKKEEPKAEIKTEPKVEPKVEEPKPYQGSPPLLY